MGFFRKKKKKSSRTRGKARSSESGVSRAVEPPSRPQVPPEYGKESRETRPLASTRSKPRIGTPMEVKLLAIEAWESGLTSRAVAELAGVSSATIDAWRKLHRDGGVEALSRKPSSPNARRICRELEERIAAHRLAHPGRGVRRIRDDLRQEQALEVSAETVRRVVNDAGLGNPAPWSKRRPPQVRRFERALPNAMWQIDIFTFQLKRHYPVYLIGLIDDHSRYIVGWGLYRQQKADAVLEVLKGAIGEWGAPRELLSDNGRQFVAWRGKSCFQKVLTPGCAARAQRAAPSDDTRENRKILEDHLGCISGGSGLRFVCRRDAEDRALDCVVRPSAPTSGHRRRVPGGPFLRRVRRQGRVASRSATRGSGRTGTAPGMEPTIDGTDARHPAQESGAVARPEADGTE